MLTVVEPESKQAESVTHTLDFKNLAKEKNWSFKIDYMLKSQYFVYSVSKNVIYLALAGVAQWIEY